jgi:hypothetical protein
MAAQAAVISRGRRLRAALAAVLVRDNAPELRAPRAGDRAGLRSLLMSLLTELDAFYTEHRRCGELEAGIDDLVIWMVCECCAVLVRVVAFG